MEKIENLEKIYSVGITKEIDEEARTLVAYASTPVVDRIGDLIAPNAWQLDNYLKHPIVFISHNYSPDHWFGNTEWIKATKKGLLFQPHAATTPMADEAFQFIQDTGIAAFSVGARPLEWKQMTVGELPDNLKEGVPKHMKSGDIITLFTKVELLEISLVGIPMCATAVLVAGKKGLIKSAELMSIIQPAIDEFDEKDPNLDEKVAENAAKKKELDKTWKFSDKDWLYLCHHMHENPKNILDIEQLHHCDLFTEKNMKGDVYTQKHVKNGKKHLHAIDTDDVKSVPKSLYGHLGNEFKITKKTIDGEQYAVLASIINKEGINLFNSDTTELINIGKNVVIEKKEFDKIIKEATKELRAEIDSLKTKQSAGEIDLEKIDVTKKDVTKEQIMELLDKKFGKPDTTVIQEVVRSTIAKIRGEV